MRFELKIVLGLVTIIIIFCMIYGNRKNNEAFTDAPPAPPAPPAPDSSPNTSPPPISSQLTTADVSLNRLNDFTRNLGAASTTDVSPAQLNDVKNDITSQINQLSSLLSNINNQITLTQNLSVLNNPSSTNNGMDIKTIQLLQDKEIERLTERLTKLKALYNSYRQSQIVDEQPKIPIYSSCIVSEASGEYSLNNANANVSDPQRSNQKPIVYASQAVVPGVQDYNPNRDLNLNKNSFTFEEIMNELAQNKINVNFNST
jgi:hypothetical protein